MTDGQLSFEDPHWNYSDPRQAMNSHDIGARVRAAFPPGRRAHDRTPAIVWPLYGVLAVLAAGYAALELAGVNWSWLSGWGVDAFELFAGGLCLLKATTLRRGRAVPLLLARGWCPGPSATPC